SFSPSPITTTPSIETVSIMRRIASTATWSAEYLSPSPTHRPAANAAASVTRTSSKARLRSGRSVIGASRSTSRGRTRILRRTLLEDPSVDVPRQGALERLGDRPVTDLELLLGPRRVEPVSVQERPHDLPADRGLSSA